MNDDLTFNKNNPDVLLLLANLSSDEVFTPPKIVNLMLDMLPQNLFENPYAKFLDPASKSGVFLREIAKRLIKGLENKIPVLEERVNHILHEQLYGIGITELTAFISRRTLYCTMNPQSVFSVCKFDDNEGNIRFENCTHKFNKKGRCDFCGVSKEKLERSEDEDTHAYEFIHVLKPERIFDMKFDVVISNPPYQINIGVKKENYAIPIYHKFVEQAKKLNPKYISMIIPSRWFAGGRGLDKFRETMLKDKHILKIVDFPDSKECFNGVDVAGGVCYFLWNRDKEGDCEFIANKGDKQISMIRKLDEFEIFPRYIEALSIIYKILAKKEKTMLERVSVQTPFGFITTYKGNQEPFQNSIKLKTSTIDSYVSREDVKKNSHIIDKYKVIFGAATSEHGGTPGKDGRFRVFSSLEILPPGVICTQSYFVADYFDDLEKANNLLLYLKTKMVRFLVLQSLTSQHLSKASFQFVPMQDFSKSWTDEELYKKYNLDENEISFIESMIRPMELGVRS